MHSIGTIDMLHIPGGPGIRFDSAMFVGYTIPPQYDSMIGKLIAFGQTREIAIAKMRSALTELVVDGVETNIDFEFELLHNEDVVSGNLDTGLIARIMEE